MSNNEHRSSLFLYMKLKNLYLEIKDFWQSRNRFGRLPLQLPLQLLILFLHALDQFTELRNCQLSVR